MVGQDFFYRMMASITGQGEVKAILNDPTLYLIQTQSQCYTGKIAFQNDTFMKVELKTQSPKVVKILKVNIKKVEILNHRG